MGEDLLGEDLPGDGWRKTDKRHPRRNRTRAEFKSTDAGGGIREVGIELCLKESEVSAAQCIVFLILLVLRIITLFKAQLDSDLPEAASGIRTAPSSRTSALPFHAFDIW